MIGTCNGLLCFLDSPKGVIRVVEPFTGDSIAVPLPSAGASRTRAYCFGFDATARRFKIVHGCFGAKVVYDGYFFPPSIHSPAEQELRVFTVGEDKGWRTARIRRAQHGEFYGDPACDGGAAYWYSQGTNGILRCARFDLGTEKIRSVRRRLVDGHGHISCRHAWWLPPSFEMCVIGVRWFGEWEHGCWADSIDAVAHEAYAVAMPKGRRLPGPHALQRGHLLLQEEDGTLNAQTIGKSSAKNLDLGWQWGSKRLTEIGSSMEVEEEPAVTYRFAPVSRRGKVPVVRGGRTISVQRA